MLLVDDYKRMTAVFFLKNKSEAFENFKGNGWKWNGFKNKMFDIG